MRDGAEVTVNGTLIAGPTPIRHGDVISLLSFSPTAFKLVNWNDVAEAVRSKGNVFFNLL